MERLNWQKKKNGNMNNVLLKTLQHTPDGLCNYATLNKKKILNNIHTT
jgi:hypothetical protein